MNIGERIKKRRQELEISVEELAIQLGKNRATVYRYESQYIENLPLSILEPLAEALYTTPAYLMGWTNDPTFKTNITNENTTSLVITEDSEKTLIKKYRSIDQRGKETVDSVLDTEYKRISENNNDTVLVYRAARSSDHTPDGMVEMSRERLKKLQDAPETDEKF